MSVTLVDICANCVCFDQPAQSIDLIIVQCAETGFISNSKSFKFSSRHFAIHDEKIHT